MSTRLPYARFETRAPDGYDNGGYERWRSYEFVESEGRRKDVYVSVHRLAAVAWGIIDGLDDERHVHHSISHPFLNTEDNLVAVEPDEHGAHHLQGEEVFA